MSVDTVNYQELHDDIAEHDKLLGDDDISLISDIEIELEVVIGRTKVSVSKLYELSRGEVIELDTDVNSTVEILLNDKVVAQGNLVVSGNNYGVEITETIHDDRKRD